MKGRSDDRKMTSIKAIIDRLRLLQSIARESNDWDEVIDITRETERIVDELIEGEI